MNTEKISYFTSKLQDELKVVESELSTIGIKNPENPSDWEATGGTIDSTATEKDELADRMEEYTANRAIVDELEIRYNNIKRALKKIKDGTYGICEVSKEPIEEDRLEANPAARTCGEHMNQESSLLA